MPLKLGKMPAETEKVGIVLMFKVGKGWPERWAVEMLVGAKIPDGRNPVLGAENVGMWLVTGEGRSKRVLVTVVVPLVRVVVPSGS